MKAIVFGANGGLGKTFQAHVQKTEYKGDWTFLSHQDLDIKDEVAARARIQVLKPHLVINAAAYNAVDKAETEKEEAFAINAEAVGRLAKICADNKIPFITYSTDYVFDGQESLPYKEKDPTNPLSVYGQSKLEGEKQALAYPTSTVLRTSWLYSESGKSFPKFILEKILADEPLKIVNDQIGSPTFALDLMRATLKIYALGVNGLLHFAGSGHTSWHGLACETVEIYNKKKNRNLLLPEAISSDQYPQKAKRPSYSVLCSDRIRKRSILTRPWKMALEDYVDSLIRSGL